MVWQSATPLAKPRILPQRGVSQLANTHNCAQSRRTPSTRFQVLQVVLARRAGMARRVASCATPKINRSESALRLDAALMTDNLVIIAGGGIGGLTKALKLNQIGVGCMVFEAESVMWSLRGVS